MGHLQMGLAADAEHPHVIVTVTENGYGFLVDE